MFVCPLMKFNIPILVLLVISIFFIVSCNNNLGEQPFPKIKTIDVTMISDTGAQFRAEIIDIPDGCEILDYGFVWSREEKPISAFEKVSLGKNASTGLFSAFANYAMLEGVKYYFKAYVRTATVTVYGNELSFISLGSHAPQIIALSRDSGSLKDTITIKGKYFSYSSTEMDVLFNDRTIPKLYNCNTDSSILIVIPYFLDTEFNKISIKYGGVIYPSKIIFKLVSKIKQPLYIGLM
jgi:hypothetical protein